MEMSGQLHAPAALPWVRVLSMHCIETWVGTTACLNVGQTEKSLSLLGIKPQLPRPVTLLTELSQLIRIIMFNVHFNMYANK
jgi:hypothetical protein